MPEPPDFEQIARASLHLTAGAFGMAGSHITVDDLVEQLRQIWNARGAADIEAKHAAFRVDVGLGGALADLEDEAIRKLDAIRSLDR